MPKPVKPSRRQFLSNAALSASALPLPSFLTAGRSSSPRKPDQWLEPGPGFQMDFWCLPRVQFWSFDNLDPVHQVYGYSFSVQVVTSGPDENTYSLDAGSLSKSNDSGGVLIRATSLASAGQAERVPGSCEVRAVGKGDRVEITTRATVDNGVVRAVKLIFRELPQGRIGFTSWESVPNLAPVPPESLALAYPTYQGGAPVWFLATEDATGISFSSLDVTARPRRFVASRESNGGTRIELIFEEDRRHWSDTVTTPAWELTRNTTLDAAIAERVTLLEQRAGLQPWERRTDVPPWVQDIGLVVCLHGMHWSGYMHGNYAAMQESIEWITERFPGRHVLFFVAGWEGRYYRSYGNSVPNERMGGGAKFQSMLAAAHGRGAHVMAMYAGNAAMPGTPNFEVYSRNSGFQADGNQSWTPMRGYLTDWMTVRGSDTNGSAWLNPGAPGWRQHLTGQVRATVRDFGIDGAFFDTQPNTENDRVYPPIDGLKQIVADLRSEHPDLMIATESWLDTTFAFLHAGQTPAAYNNWSSRFGRRFAHLAMGEPSRGSTGVHEAGYCAYNFDQVMACFDWPTVALVDTTLKDAPEKVERVLQFAKARLHRG